MKSNGSRDKIGYVILAMRSAQILLKNEEQKLKFVWQKMLGLRNDLKGANKEKPELCIAFTVQETNPAEKKVVYNWFSFMTLFRF